MKYNEDEVTYTEYNKIKKALNTLNENKDEKEIQREWKALCCIEITIEHISGKQAIELVNKNYQDLF